MLKVVEKSINQPVNLGSGDGVSIKKIAEIITKNIQGKKIDIVWDKTKNSGDKMRIMDVSIARSLGITNEVSIEAGIKETIKWFLENKNNQKRYNIFDEKK